MSLLDAINCFCSFLLGAGSHINFRIVLIKNLCKLLAAAR